MAGGGGVATAGSAVPAQALPPPPASAEEVEALAADMHEDELPGRFLRATGGDVDEAKKR